MTQLVVLCGGLGTRMASVSGGVQKCMLPVAGRPFLSHVLDRAVRPPVDRVLLLAGHDARSVRELARAWQPPHQGELPSIPLAGTETPLHVETLVEAAPAGPVGALREALSRLDEEFLLVLGDVLPPDRRDLWQALSGTLRRQQAQAVMSVAPESRSHDPGNISVDGPWVDRYDKGSGAPYIDRGVRFLRRDALESHPGDSDNPFFGALAAQRGLAHWICDESIIEIGTPDRWRHACATLADLPSGPCTTPSRAERQRR
ncbi:NTP transferase domain-containing protein [Streptomyces griseoaurantiacus]|uniref:Mannose-1-phosphate guanylyltransferase/D-glycero-D-manno-heptose 1,7-bisphosphate phosphatase n=1 Tax=Streptomyces griseoaurantiacus TaxID=68213 RepID=A0A1G7J816_9ACTN|nr:NTP transferase domain-containing protein [Streptomyces jietaisiensis]SDF21122.1 mannose-1-phosphate guanylyltransferase/D-glycero-D-manno-heptose 1,7-bisphosphate phosphatase [Streptomyces jietaisiensis]